MRPIVLKTELEGLQLASRGKVRDIYDLGEELLVVVTDRISAFDRVLPCGIPDKGRVLNLLSEFWFEKTAHIVKNHMLSLEMGALPKHLASETEVLEGRFTIAKKAMMLPVECVVRGYLSGSAWNDYRSGGEVSGIRLPDGLRESDRLPEPIFTPSTKAEKGHDENISFEEAATLTGEGIIARVRELSLALYSFAADYAITKGIIIADTKFEFGLRNGELILCDEVLTPDSSRFWPGDSYEPGRAQPSFDKQFVRDYLISINWNKEPPVPQLPQDVILKTSEKYRDVFKMLTGRSLPA